MVRYANILTESLVDGVGLRVVAFLQGCPRRCEGCHNQALLDPTGGTAIEVRKFAELLLAQLTPLHDGITFSGGDPLLQHDALLEAVRIIREQRPDINFWLYTGYVYEEVAHLPLLGQLDIVVDGPFLLEQRDLTLPFRGSRNQRIIDVRATLQTGQVKLYRGGCLQAAG